MPDQEKHPPLLLSDIVVIGENAHYQFCVARIGERDGAVLWIGYACERRSPFAEKMRQAFAEVGFEVDPVGMYVFSEVSSSPHCLGHLDKTTAILMTGAIAQDMDSAYGGIDRWLVSPELRGDPDAFRCQTCDRIGCDGTECAYEHFDGNDFIGGSDESSESR